MNKATIKDIARESGVSTATVSRVLSKTGYASDEVRKKVIAVAKRLDYQPNEIARSLKMERTNTIGVIIPDIANPYFMKISKGIEEIVEKSGYNLLFVSSDEDSNKERKMLKVLLEKRVDAIVIATSGNNNEAIRQVKANGVPVLLIDRKIDEDQQDMDTVVEDNFQVAYQLTDYLIQHSHRNIGVVNGLLNVSTGMERFLGFKQAMRDNEIEVNEELIYDGNFIEEDGAKAVNHFLNRLNPPTAILSFNNSMTLGVILQLTRLGLVIPKDIVVSSYGETEVAQLLNPPGIICVKQEPYKMGKRAGELLLESLNNRMKAPTQEVYRPKVVFSNKSS